MNLQLVEHAKPWHRALHLAVVANMACSAGHIAGNDCFSLPRCRFIALSTLNLIKAQVSHSLRPLMRSFKVLSKC